MYVCMYVRMHAFMYVCMYECMYVCMHACMCECVYDTNLFGWPLTRSSEEFVGVQVAPKPVTGIKLITCPRAPKLVTPYALRVPYGASRLRPSKSAARVTS